LIRQRIRLCSVSEYDEAQWRQIADPPPLAGLGQEDFMLLHRHWIWANQQRLSFDQALTQCDERIDEGFLAKPMAGSMLIWYGLLWAVIEAMQDREIDLRDPLDADVREIGCLLRKCRNAVLHVPRSGEYVDQRILDLMAHPESPHLLRTVHRAFGRMFLEELERRKEQREQRP
jgi:hypothetical protein